MCWYHQRSPWKMICCSSLFLERHRYHSRRYLFFPPKNIRLLREASVFGFRLLLACPCWASKEGDSVKPMNPMNNGVAYADITELDGAIMAHLLAVLRRVAFLMMSPSVVSWLTSASRQKGSFRLPLLLVCLPPVSKGTATKVNGNTSTVLRLSRSHLDSSPALVKERIKRKTTH